MSIGVGVSDDVAGPFVDAIGGPLIVHSQIDPSVFIDDDGQAYLYFGNPDLLYVTLNDDIISYSGEVTQVELTAEGFGVREGNPDRPTMYEEGPWLYKRENTYYMIFAANCCAENIQYSTGPTATGPWTYRGVIMPAEGGAFTNHAGVVEYKGQSYFLYHNGALPGGGGFTRSVAIESFDYNPDGSIPELRMTTEGPAQVSSLNPYIKQEAETMAWAGGVETEVCSEGSLNIWSINNGDYIKVNGVDFGEGASAFTARVASAAAGGSIEIRLGGQDGALVGVCDVPGTGGWQNRETVGCVVDGATGIHDLYFVFAGEGTNDLFNFNWWQFEK